MKNNQELSPYEVRMKNWDIEQNKYCQNYLHTKDWAEQNGFLLSRDISYNGFIYLKKEICKTENPHDGYLLEIQVYDGTDSRKWHNLEQYEMRANFGNIMDETTYSYKVSNGDGTNFASQNLQELFDFVLKRETILIAEHNEYYKKRAEREELWAKNPELKEKYYSDLLDSLKKK
jgi:hypothetical protein